MAKMDYDLEAGIPPSRSSTRAKEGRAKEDRAKEGAVSKWARRIIPILFALTLLAAGFLLAKSYIEQVQEQLTQIQREADALNHNVAQVQAALTAHQADLEQLHAAIANIDEEMMAVKEELALAGDSLQSSDDTRLALSQRIADLGKELASLKTLIAKLEEAARVY